MIESKYMTIDEDRFEYEYRDAPKSIKKAFNLLKENKDKVNGNEWEPLINKDIYVVEICIKANIEFLEYLDTIVTHAFAGNQWLKAIRIPNNIKSIGAGAFFDCGKLEKVIIPSSVNYLDSECFKDCSRLNTIEYEGILQEWSWPHCWRCS